MIVNPPSGFEKPTSQVNPSGLAHGHIRKLLLKRDAVATVRTSLGIATLIDLGAHPLPAIIGDSQSFKLEYTENGVTIKPLRANAQTNLYLFTDGAQFNVELRTVDKTRSDYVVYLKREADAQNRPRPSESRSMLLVGVEGRLLALKLSQASVVENRLTLEFKITARQQLTLKPEWFYVTKAGKVFPIDQLEIEKIKVSSGESVTVRITLAADEFLQTDAGQLEIRAPHKIVLSLKGVKKWINR